MGAIGYNGKIYPAGSTAAADSVFDNTGTGLSATNAEDAIKEVNDKIILPDNITIIVKGDSLALADYGPAGLKNARGNRGKDITEYFNDGTLGDRIAGTNGFKEFEDIELWDVITMPRAVTAPGSSVTGTTKVHIGEFNPLNAYQFGGTVKNHVYIIPETHFGMGQYHKTASGVYESGDNTITGGYVGENINKNLIGPVASTGSTSGTINQQLKAIFGNMLQTTNELLTTAVNATGYNRFGAASGCSSNWAWTQVQAVLMSELEVHGSIVWSSSGYDTGNAKRQIAAFRNDQRAQYPQGIYFYEKDIATAIRACRADGGDGDADYVGSSIGNYVRPRSVLAKAS